MAAWALVFLSDLLPCPPSLPLDLSPCTVLGTGSLSSLGIYLYRLCLVKTAPSIKYMRKWMNQVGIGSGLVSYLFWIFQVSSSHLHSNTKDYSLPNASWSPIMVRLYNEHMEKMVVGTGTRLPGYLRSLQFLKDLARITKAVPGKFTSLYQEHLTSAGAGLWLVQDCWQIFAYVCAFSSRNSAPAQFQHLLCGLH